MLASLRMIVARDLVLAMRRNADLATPLAFYLMVASLFPLTVGAYTDLLRQMAPGRWWKINSGMWTQCSTRRRQLQRARNRSHDD